MNFGNFNLGMKFKFNLNFGTLNFDMPKLKFKFKFRNIAKASTALKLTHAYKKTAQKTPPLSAKLSLQVTMHYSLLGMKVIKLTANIPLTLAPQPLLILPGHHRNLHHRITRQTHPLNLLSPASTA